MSLEFTVPCSTPDVSYLYSYTYNWETSTSFQYSEGTQHHSHYGMQFGSSSKSYSQNQTVQQFHSQVHAQNKLKTETHTHLHTNVHCSIIHNRQKGETTQRMSFDRRVNKMWDAQNEILLNHKVWSSDTCYSLEEPGKYHGKWNKSDSRGQILYDST